MPPGTESMYCSRCDYEWCGTCSHQGTAEKAAAEKATKEAAEKAAAEKAAKGAAEKGGTKKATKGAATAGQDYKRGERDFTQNQGDALRIKYDFDSPTKLYNNGVVARNNTRTIRGLLTGREIRIPDVSSGMPVCLVDNGPDGGRVPGWDNKDGEWLDRGKAGFPDHLEYNRKFMVVVPSTNTTVEHDYWRLLLSQPELKGIGFHTAPILISAPKLVTDEDMLEFLVQFRKEIMYTVDVAMTAEPEYLIMGMSAETFFGGWEGNKELMEEISNRCGLAVATGAEACKYALEAFGKEADGTNKIKTISVVTPYVSIGDVNVVKFFEEVGFKVKYIHGFRAGSATDIGHIPDQASERVLRKLAKGDKDGPPDAIVQCGTNLSIIAMMDRMEAELGIPMIPINAATLWFALRENGFTQKIPHATRLLREF
jgi:maleate isomerase